MSRPLRVLLVEDPADGRESLRPLLEQWGHACRTAPDVPAGVELALAWRPEAALLDLGQPGCDGLETCRRLRSDLGPGVLLAALTPYDGEETTRRVMGAGFDRLFVKPANPQEFRRLLDSQAALVRWQAGDP